MLYCAEVKCKAQRRGTHGSNPNQGALAAQVEANKKSNRVPEPQQEERVVVSFCVILRGDYAS
jgi:hypothetical protein